VEAKVSHVRDATYILEDAGIEIDSTSRIGYLVNEIVRMAEDLDETTEFVGLVGPDSHRRKTSV
jgi:hypothetical protein